MRVAMMDPRLRFLYTLSAGLVAASVLLTGAWAETWVDVALGTCGAVLGACPLLFSSKRSFAFLSAASALASAAAGLAVLGVLLLGYAAIELPDAGEGSCVARWGFRTCAAEIAPGMLITASVLCCAGIVLFCAARSSYQVYQAPETVSELAEGISGRAVVFSFADSLRSGPCVAGGAGGGATAAAICEAC
mmetsp:Transcript_96837/g.312721  ORF Transcript_96837/g.312721 Transcript_96837/m.312721 type:complete len:191 (+) Transcript_96837:80-652(+)